MNRSPFPKVKLNTSIDPLDKQIIEDERITIAATKKANLNQGDVVSIALHFWLDHRAEYSNEYSELPVNSSLAVSRHQPAPATRKKKPAVTRRQSAA